LADANITAAIKNIDNLDDVHALGEEKGIFDKIKDRAISVTGSVMGVIPFVGSIMSLATAAQEELNSDYTNGRACVPDPAVNSHWGEHKYYQAYMQDQQILEDSGMIEKSTITAFLEDYYKIFPPDNSFEGVIARYSGLPKEEVEDVIAFLDHIDFLSGYEPVAYGPLHNTSDIIDFDLPTDSDHSILALNSSHSFAHPAILGRADYVAYFKLRREAYIG